MTENTQQAPKQITGVIDAVFGGADAHQWSSVQGAMTETIHVDYAELGGPSGAQSAASLVEGWAAFLPGFDRTVHKLHNLAVHVAGERASATFDGIAVHLLQVEGELRYWTVFAGYDTEFEQVDGAWKLARIALSLYRQAGDLELPTRVAGPTGRAREEASPHPIVERFFTAFEAGDLDGLVATLADDAVQEMPLAPEGFPPAVEGRDALRGLFGNVIEFPAKFERRYHATGSDRAVLVSFDGKVDIGGEPYANSYVNLFLLDDAGQIVRIVEHFNPNTLLAGWPGLQPPHHSVHAAGAPTADVTARAVSFERNGVTLRGQLFTPTGFDPDASHPAVIVAGSWTSVKEQMAGMYASRLAAEGIVALTFDFAGFGESDGLPRQVEDPAQKIEDIKAAFGFLKRQPGVDASAIAGMGVCAGAGYMAHAVAQESGFAKLLLVAPWLHDQGIATEIYDMRPGGTEGLLAASRDAAKQHADGGDMPYVLATSELDPLSAMYVPDNVFDYYLNPAKGAGRIYDNRFAVASWEPWITFDGISAGASIQQPVRVVHSHSGAVPQGTERFLESHKGPHEVTWLDDYGQEDFYHRAPAVDAAVEIARTFLR
jgi:fermentation-respiration switch protein FrsA (DUF1100 family)/ketosteroid isomerase-like protein